MMIGLTWGVLLLALSSEAFTPKGFHKLRLAGWSKMSLADATVEKVEVDAEAGLLYAASKRMSVFQASGGEAGALLTVSLRTTGTSGTSGGTSGSTSGTGAGGALLSARVVQQTSGPVPRSYLPSLLLLSVEGGMDSEGGGGLGVGVGAVVSGGVAVEASEVAALVEAALRWYLDSGGRISLIELSAPHSLMPALLEMGAVKSTPASASASTSTPTSASASTSTPTSASASTSTPTSTSASTGDLFSFPAQALMQSSLARVKQLESQGQGQETTARRSALLDLAGRLAHSEQDPEAAVTHYTASLTLLSAQAATFRNLGAAYHALDNTQLAYASYQQAIQLDQADCQVYLKLAYLYEAFADKDFTEAAANAAQCYRHYLANVDSSDVSVLTRLANLYVRENMHIEAVEVYDTILGLDGAEGGAWFNKAYAQVKMCDYLGASESFARTLALDPHNSAARHMLQAFDDLQAVSVRTVDVQYVLDLFTTYAPTYDAHGKKLIYSAPRVIRQELANVYKARYTTRGPDGALIVDKEKIASLKAETSVVDTFEPEDQCESPSKDTRVTDFVPGVGGVGVGAAAAAGAGVGAGCSTYTSFMNRSLDILDLGCGTGQVGAWLKDYSRTLRGVDVTPAMLQVARKKGLYDSLYEMPALQFLEQLQGQGTGTGMGDMGLGAGQRDFDVVVAADLFAYVGDLGTLFPQIFKALRPTGLFAFTVEAAEEEEAGGKPPPLGYRLLKSGRFGFTRQYISSLVGGLGGAYEILLSRDYSPRLDAGMPTRGYLYIVQKN